MEELSVLQTACSVGQLRDVNLTIDEYFEVGYWPRDVVVSEISKLDDWERGIVLRVLTDYDGPERRRLLRDSASSEARRELEAVLRERPSDT